MCLTFPIPATCPPHATTRRPLAHHSSPSRATCRRHPHPAHRPDAAHHSSPSRASCRATCPRHPHPPRRQRSIARPHKPPIRSPGRPQSFSEQRIGPRRSGPNHPGHRPRQKWSVPSFARCPAPCRVDTRCRPLHVRGRTRRALRETARSNSIMSRPTRSAAPPASTTSSCAAEPITIWPQNTTSVVPSWHARNVKGRRACRPGTTAAYACGLTPADDPGRAGPIGGSGACQWQPDGPESSEALRRLAVAIVIFLDATLGALDRRLSHLDEIVLPAPST